MSQMRRAVITGAASGLGRALAVRLARDGWYLALCDIDDDGSRRTLEEVRRAGGDGQVEHLDVSSVEAWQSLGERLRGSWPRLDLLVNNAGVGSAGEIARYPLEDWRWVLAINLYGAIYGCHTFVDWLKANSDGGAILNVASLAALVPAAPLSAYNVAKAGVLALSETLYSELAPHGVSVTVVCPAFFDTKLVAAGRFTSAPWKEMAADACRRSTMSAEYVADQAIRAMRSRRFYVVLPRSSRLAWWLKRMAPAWFARRLASEYRSAAWGLPALSAAAPNKTGENSSEGVGLLSPGERKA